MSKLPIRKGSLDSTDIDIDNEVVTTSIDDTEKGVDGRASGIVVEQTYSSAALEMEAFMAQPIDVMLMEPSDENEPFFAQLTVNGVCRMVPRDGNIHTIPRAHVEALCNAKPQRVTQRKVVAIDGSMGYVEDKKTSLSYPFSVVSDPAGARGAEWLKSKIKAAATA